MAKSMSGIEIGRDIIELAEKLRKDGHVRYIILKIEDAKRVALDKTSSPTADFDELLNDIKDDECRYILYDHPRENPKSKDDKGKVVIISWCPDGSGLRDKMVYSTTFSALRTACNYNIYLECNDRSDLTLEEVKRKARV